LSEKSLASKRLICFMVFSSAELLLKPRPF
jgi:hypothetical protein